MSRFFLDDYGFKMPEIPGTSAAYVFSAEYQAVYDSFVVKPAADIAQQQDIMVRALVAGGVWTIKDILYIIANNTRENAVINWINPGTYDAIEVNAPTFLAYRHFVGNGVNQYLRTQFNPTVAGGNFVQNSASFGTYIRNNIVEDRLDIGGFDGVVYADLATRAAGNVQVARINNGAAALGGAVLDSTGFWVVTRRDAANIFSYRNAVQRTAAIASTGLLNVEIFILCRNDAPAALFSTKQSAAAFVGGGLTQAQVTTFMNALETYLDYVGAGVIP